MRVRVWTEVLAWGWVGYRRNPRALVHPYYPPTDLEVREYCCERVRRNEMGMTSERVRRNEMGV